LKPEDSLLLISLKEGNEDAFATLFHTYYPGLCLYARKIVGDLDAAKELVQDVFVRLYEIRQELPEIHSLKSYLYRTVHNACLNQVKQVHIYSAHHQQIKYQSEEGYDADMLIQSELEERISQAIQGLSTQCRTIFEMNRFEGKKNKEIAQELNLSIRTVETQISKALRILRQELQDLFLLLLLVATLLLNR
jgi:RNA polymerase sigma-70 factor (ECF subfamily)